MPRQTNDVISSKNESFFKLIPSDDRFQTVIFDNRHIFQELQNRAENFSREVNDIPELINKSDKFEDCEQNQDKYYFSSTYNLNC